VSGRMTGGRYALPRRSGGDDLQELDMTAGDPDEERYSYQV